MPCGPGRSAGTSFLKLKLSPWHLKGDEAQWQGLVSSFLTFQSFLLQGLVQISLIWWPGPKALVKFLNVEYAAFQVQRNWVGIGPLPLVGGVRPAADPDTPQGAHLRCGTLDFVFVRGPTTSAYLYPSGMQDSVVCFLSSIIGVIESQDTRSGPQCSASVQ